MQIFVALADPVRREIVEALAAREQAVGDLVVRFDVSQPAISRHLRVLREAGLVRVRADGQRRLYASTRRGSRRSTRGSTCTGARSRGNSMRSNDISTRRTKGRTR